jgi:hypothetical protein
MVVLAALAMAAPASAKRLLLIVDGKATNGYHYSLQAEKSADGEKTVSIELSRDEASAFYAVRHPQRFDRRRLVARFGDMGRVSLRVDREHDSCGGFGFDFFKQFRGAIRFDGESVYTRVRDERPTGFVIGAGCRDHGVQVSVPRRSHDPIVSSCSDDGRTGFFAAKEEPGGPSAFLAARFERTPDLLIGRTMFIEGATKNLKYLDGGRRAKVRPPEPFYGRAEIERRRIRGRLRAALPGAGLVTLAPGDAELVQPHRFTPTCFPFALARSAGSENVERFARAIGR